MEVFEMSGEKLIMVMSFELSPSLDEWLGNWKQ